MKLSLQQWCERYRQQASWTRGIRVNLFERARIHSTDRILEVGCGPGVLLDEVYQEYHIPIYGVDIDFNSCAFTKASVSKAKLTVGDGLSLPYHAGSFDIVFSHFLLLWVKNPGRVLKEMVRVVRPGGFVLALAEPDYGGRIDYPITLSNIGKWQSEALKAQGANPQIGRELRSLFSNAKLTQIEVGILSGRWTKNENADDLAREWEIINSDLQNNPEFLLLSEELKKLDQLSRETQQRILFVPTFYAIGVKELN